MNIKRITSWQSKEDTSNLAGIIRVGLFILSLGYGAIIYVRNFLFDIKLRPTTRLNRKTISIGNITTGGTGKTPFAIEIADRIKNMNKNPAVILRGYKSQEGKSDEALLISDKLGNDVAVICNSDRKKGASLVLNQNPNTDIFVLDDSFQHRQIHRDLDIVLIDALAPFGFNYVLPRGMLREPIGGLKRADGVIITRVDQVSKSALWDIDEKIKSITGKAPLAHVTFKWNALLDEKDNKHPIEKLAAMKVAGICGVGNPKSFFNTLQEKSKSAVNKIALNDHHHPKRAELITLLNSAKQDKADAIVTTEKDWVKWRDILDNDFKSPLPILRPRLTPLFLYGEEEVDKLLKNL